MGSTCDPAKMIPMTANITIGDCFEGLDGRMMRFHNVSSGFNFQNMSRLIPETADGLLYVPQIAFDRVTVTSFELQLKNDLNSFGKCMYDSEDEVEGLSFKKFCHEG